MTAAKAADKKTTKVTETKKTESASKKTASTAAEKVVKKTTKKVAGPKTKKGAPLAHGVGRRKASVARVWLRKGSGNFTVNARECDEYFTTDIARLTAKIPLRLVPAAAKSYDIEVNVVGGGVTGQADAVKLAVARALVKIDEAFRAILKENGLLTVDSRVVERKKYGQRKARRKFQFVKR